MLMQSDDAVRYDFGKTLFCAHVLESDPTLRRGKSFRVGSKCVFVWSVLFSSAVGHFGIVISCVRNGG